MNTKEFTDTKEFAKYVKTVVADSGKTQGWVADRLSIGQPAVNHALNNTEPGRYDKTRIDILHLFNFLVDIVIRVK